jgi:hypothetical protein
MERSFQAARISLKPALLFIANQRAIDLFQTRKGVAERLTLSQPLPFMGLKCGRYPLELALEFTRLFASFEVVVPDMCTNRRPHELKV